MIRRLSELAAGHMYVRPRENAAGLSVLPLWEGLEGFTCVVSDPTCWRTVGWHLRELVDDDLLVESQLVRQQVAPVSLADGARFLGATGRGMVEAVAIAAEFQRDVLLQRRTRSGSEAPRTACRVITADVHEYVVELDRGREAWRYADTLSVIDAQPLTAPRWTGHRYAC